MQEYNKNSILPQIGQRSNSEEAAQIYGNNNYGNNSKGASYQRYKNGAGSSSNENSSIAWLGSDFKARERMLQESFELCQKKLD